MQQNLKKRILFVGEGVTLAHITRPIVLAESLIGHNHEVLFACSHSVKGYVAQAGYDVYEIPTITPDIFLNRLAKGQPLYTYDELASYVEAEIKMCKELLPDLIVGDFRISLGITADYLRIPYVSLSNAHWSPYSTQPFPVPDLGIVKFLGVGLTKMLLPGVLPIIFRQHARAFNSLRRSFGLEPVDGLKHLYTHGTWTMYADIPSIAPTEYLPENHRYIGPIIWSPDIELPSWWKEVPEGMPIIYVTMGSSGDISLLKSILDAIRKTSCIGLVATAGRINIAEAPNLFISNYLPGIDVIKKASVVICSGGSATAYQALSLGVPVIGFPSNADQFFTMESIQMNGAGLLIRSKDAFPDVIARAITTVLNDRRYKISSDNLAAEISEYDAKKLFSEFVSNWAQQKC